MKIRMRATGQVEDFDPAFARRAIESGMAESMEAPLKKEEKTGMPGFGAPETAAFAPPETAAMARPLFTRVLRSIR